MAAAPRKSPRVGSVGRGVETSLKAAEWITPADAATVALTKALAKSIDGGEVSPQLAARLLDALKALGLTTTSRADLGLDKKREEENPLATLRAKATGTSGRLTGSAYLHAVPESPKPRRKPR